jgi:hypothetical protein
MTTSLVVLHSTYSAQGVQGAADLQIDLHESEDEAIGERIMEAMNMEKDKVRARESSTRFFSYFFREPFSSSFFF